VGPDALSVVAVPDDRKGEKLCVIHMSLSKNQDEMRQILKDLGIPNLWKPRLTGEWKLSKGLGLS